MGGGGRVVGVVLVVFVVVAGGLAGLEAGDDAVVALEEGIAADGVVVVAAAVAALEHVAGDEPLAGYVAILRTAMRAFGDVGRGICSGAEGRSLQGWLAGSGDALGAGLVLRGGRGRQGR